MTTTNNTPAVLTPAQLATQTALLPLLKEFKTSENKINRALGVITKQETIVALNRAIGGRVIAKIVEVPGMSNKSGKPIVSKIATALGMGNDATALWVKGAELVTIQVAAGELTLEESPSEAEIALFNSPWTDAANNRKERRAKGNKGTNETTDETTTDKDPRDTDGTKGGDSDTTGLTFADIMVKVNELKATVELAARNNVTVTDADNDAINEVMAGVMATLSSMS